MQPQSRAPHEFFERVRSLLTATKATLGHDNAPRGAELIKDYHARTKHHLNRYAPSLGYLDWANQPDSFREYKGAPRIHLALAEHDDTPPFRELFQGPTVAPRRFETPNLSLFLELSLALSAWKQSGESRWALRINPSSGNLHPTEAYLLLPPGLELVSQPGIYHYLSRDHVLEQRATWSWAATEKPTGFFVALTSICWREAWKYGERAFRYCQHDTGHALAALRFSAASLGWRLELMDTWLEAVLSALLGLDRQADFAAVEPEIPELIAWVSTAEGPPPVTSGVPAPPVREDGSAPWIGRFAGAATWFGKPNQLSSERVEWPLMQTAIHASQRGRTPTVSVQMASAQAELAAPRVRASATAARIFRQRRSAVAFDRSGHMALEDFLAILDLTLPRRRSPPFDVGLGPPQCHLALFVHRVDALAPGLYFWLRNPEHGTALRAAMHPGFEWTPIPSPNDRLFRLAAVEAADFARAVACHQDIAADGVFSLGMLTRFSPVLESDGAAAYRRLFWEAGMIGQALYLAAEATGYRGTGIGCYFDDVMHEALGLKNDTWQSLYHFTIGVPVEDKRLETIAPYASSISSAPERRPSV